jgi:catechol 1,2-dioxygenase/hydroxyquinol 1,2-dioxygenase
MPSPARVNLTPAEWIKGIEFMTAAGKMCSPERQEFILLSDTLGLSALVNGLHDATALEEATHTSLLGPFYREATPTLAAGSSIAKNPKPGSECVLYGRVTDATGKPVANATVSIWQTGADGLYDIQASATSVDYRGVFATDADGLYVLRTVKPLGYSIPMDGPVGAMVKAQARHGMRPAHIHFLVGAPAIANCHRALSARRSASGRRRRVRLVGRSRRRRGRQRSGLPDQGHASIRFDMRFRARARPTRPAGASAPIRRRS